VVVLLVIVSAVVVLAAAIMAARMLVRRRSGRGLIRLTAAIPVHAQWWREQAAKDGELLYVAIGDSAAQGIGGSNPGRSYVGLVAKHLRERSGRTVRVANVSQSGARLREAVDILLPRFRKLSPDIVTFSVGANDMTTFEPERFERELRTIYSALPVGTIVADIPSFYIGRAEANVRRANSIVRRLADEFGFAVAPLYARTKRQGLTLYALNQVAEDFFHPNDRGYQVWASAFLPLLDSVVPQTRRTEKDE
jgi:acyl-CoA thioesterase-1